MSTRALLTAFVAALIAACGSSGDPARDRASAGSGGGAAQVAGGASAPGDEAEIRPARTAKRGLPPGSFHVQRVEIVDHNGFDRPMPASFGLVPIGWRTRGGVQWGQQFMCTNGYAVDWSASSPDGAQMVAVLPQEKWEANNYGAGVSTPGCASASIGSVRQYLDNRVARLFAGARPVDYRTRPDLAAKFAQLSSSTPMPMGELRTWVEAGEVLFDFEQQGRAMRGALAAVAVFSLSRTAGLAMGQSMDALTGTALPAFLATAPRGELNLRFTEAIRQSFLPNPEWEARIAGHNLAIARVTQQEVAKRSRMTAEYNDYVSRIRREAADARAASDERRQREFSELIRGTETWDDADAPGGQVELSGLYDHAWKLGDGTYVLSADAGFDPWRDLGVEGRRLDRTP